MDRSFTARWRIPALIAALTAIAVALVWLISPAGRNVLHSPGASGATTTSSARPPVLVFQSGGNARNAAPMAAAAAGGTSKMMAPSGAYVLTGTLGTGPATASIHTLATPTADQVNRLAAAFGLPAAALAAGQWTATDGKHVLSVASTAGGNWWYGPKPDCADGDSKTTGNCAVRSGGGVASSPGSSVASCPSPSTKPCDDMGPVPAPSEPPVTDEATVRRAAAAILAGAGVALDGARISVQYGSITVNPLIAGLPTVGVETSVSVDLDGKVGWANGWLGASVDGDTYPVITAQQAFDKLKDQPRMYSMMCMAREPAAGPGVPEVTTSPAPDAPASVLPKSAVAATPVGTKPSVGKPYSSANPAPDLPVSGGAATDSGPIMVDPPVDMPCGGPSREPVSVTGASFGLSMQWLADERVVLAPSWLFTMKGSEQWPIPILAIDPSYLGVPDAPTTKGLPPVETGVPDSPVPAPTPLGSTSPAFSGKTP